MKTPSRFQPNTEQIVEQHSFVDPQYIDYISIRCTSKSERRYQAVGILNDAGQNLYRTGSECIDLRTTDFDTSKEARQFCRDYYKNITVQTN